MESLLCRIAGEESGQGLLEYGLLITLIAVAAVTVLLSFGAQIANLFSNASNSIP